MKTLDNIMKKVLVGMLFVGIFAVLSTIISGNCFHLFMGVAVVCLSVLLLTGYDKEEEDENIS